MRVQETPAKLQGSEVEFHVARRLEASDVALKAKSGAESGFEAVISKGRRERKTKKKGLAAMVVSANESSERVRSWR